MKNLAQKLFNIQTKVGKLAREKDNPYFKSKYFDVNQVIEHLKPLLEEEEIIVIQPLSNVAGKLSLTTIVLDKATGENIESVAILPEGLDAQKMGSAITYFRRYALQSFFLLQAEDDDANFASGKTTKKQVVNDDEPPF